MEITRRTAILAAAGSLVGAKTMETAADRLGDAAARTLVERALAPGVARTVNVTEDMAVVGESNEIQFRTAPDPAGRGRTRRDDVVYVTSRRKRTRDYAFSLVDVREQDLALSEVETLTYDYFVTRRNGVGDHDRTGPDEVWLLLESEANRRREVFRTLNRPRSEESVGTWNTRTVHEEFGPVERSPWKYLSVADNDFRELTDDLLGEYADARLLAVGIGRGDPVMGPSNVGAYYHNLQLQGIDDDSATTYSFPLPRPPLS